MLELVLHQYERIRSHVSVKQCAVPVVPFAAVKHQPIAETRPEVVALAKALGRKKPKGGKMTLRAMSAAMAAQGFLN